jgi:hypothetical protein
MGKFETCNCLQQYRVNGYCLWALPLSAPLGTYDSAYTVNHKSQHLHWRSSNTLKIVTVNKFNFSSMIVFLMQVLTYKM